MENFRNNEFGPPAPEVEKGEKLKKLTREEVIGRLERGENLEGFDLQDTHLVELNLKGKSFRGSDVRGMVLYYPEERDKKELTTNIQNTDWTDVTFADTGMTYFDNVNAEGAKFGYTEDLIARRKRHWESGQAPKPADTGSLCGFYGEGGNFKKTRWTNCDFGGGTGYEATFTGADLRESIIEGSDLSQMDFSQTKIDNLQIINPVSLKGMKINEQQAESITQAIQLSNQKNQAEFLKAIDEKGAKGALEDYFNITIVEIND